MWLTHQVFNSTIRRFNFHRHFRRQKSVYRKSFHLYHITDLQPIPIFGYGCYDIGVGNHGDGNSSSSTWGPGPVGSYRRRKSTGDYDTFNILFTVVSVFRKCFVKRRVQCLFSNNSSGICHRSTSPVFTRDLSRGSKGEDVRNLQKLLAKDKYIPRRSCNGIIRTINRKSGQEIPSEIQSSSSWKSFFGDKRVAYDSFIDFVSSPASPSVTKVPRHLPISRGEDNGLRLSLSI